MNRYLTLSGAGQIRIPEKKKTAKRNSAKSGAISLNMLFIVMICATSVFYIYQVNNSAIKGSDIQKLEKQRDELKKQNELLQIEAAEKKAMHNIEEDSKNLNMVAPKDISYLNIPGNVAMK